MRGIQKSVKNSKLKIPTSISEIGNYEKLEYKIKSFQRKCSLYPNFGVGFEITNKYDTSVKYKITNSYYKGFRATFKGIRLDKDKGQIETISDLNNYNITSNKDVITYINGATYDIHKMKALIKDKQLFLRSRSKSLNPVKKDEKKK